MELKKQMVEEYIDTLREELLDLSHFIHDNPEVGLQEHQAVQKITELLGRHGLQVKTGICGLETAFMASKEGCDVVPLIDDMAPSTMSTPASLAMSILDTPFPAVS